MRFVLSVYVENKYGVLARVSGLFMRRGFNINSLTVDETDDAAFSRITITLNGDENDKNQLINQLKKLHNVKVVRELHPETSIERELMLIKIQNSPNNRSELMQACDIFRAKIIDYSTETLCAEVTGETSKLDAFVEIMKPLGIVEMCRTGIVALERTHYISEELDK
ncbi:MAG: acetolactate synthase small subunit [Ruminococcaceae bacterium]|nr:acetolactate synthase small subunit [Oscillospiraceae bacterium]